MGSKLFYIQPTIATKVLILLLFALTLINVQGVCAHKNEGFYLMHCNLADSAFSAGNVQQCQKEITLMTRRAGNDNDNAGWAFIASRIASYAYASNMVDIGMDLEQEAMRLWQNEKGYEINYITSALTIGHYAFITGNAPLLHQIDKSLRHVLHTPSSNPNISQNLALRINNFQVFHALFHQDSIKAYNTLQIGKEYLSQKNDYPIEDQLGHWAACAGYAHIITDDLNKTIHYLMVCDTLIQNAQELKEQTYLTLLNHRNLAKFYALNHDYSHSIYHYQQVALLQEESHFDSNAHHFNTVRVHFQQSLNQYLSNQKSLAIQRFLLLGIIIAVIFVLYMIRRTLKANKRLVKVYNTLFQKEAEAKASLQAKSVFIANMSHEVRTPLNSIVGFSDMLAQEDIDNELREEGVKLIQHNAGLLMKLINDMIDMSNFTQNEIKLQISPCEVVQLSQQVLQSMRKINQTNIDIRWKSQLDTLTIETDSTRLQQVLINLMTNAIKFTKKGHIVLDLCMLNEHEVQFSISDTGIGIPLEKQKDVFKRFEKVNEFSQGTGLGLSICLLIVEKMGGRIYIDPNYTQGSRFVFTHPLRHKYHDAK